MKPSNLLLVTDSSLTRSFFEKLEEKLHEYALIISHSEQDALEKLERMTIHFIILDESTSNFNIIDLCSKLRINENIPLLVITSHLKKSFVRKLLKAGATDFLIEPLDEEECLIRMEKAMDQKKTERKMKVISAKFSTHSSSSLDERALGLIQEALTDKTPLTLLLFKIDHLDKIEYQRGSKSTEMLHQDVYAYLKKQSRAQDLLFSQKKGEFIFILPKTSQQTAQDLFKIVKESIKAQTFLIGGINLHIKVLASFATLDHEGKRDKDALFNFERLKTDALNQIEEGKS